MRLRLERSGLLLAVVALTAGVSLEARQFSRLTNPKFAVHLTHPPEIVLKGVQRIAVMSFAGECGDEFSQRLLEGIGRSGKFEVIDRGNLDALLHEQGFQASAAVSGPSAVKLGQLLGPAAMFSGRVTSCSVEDSGLLVSRNSVTGAVKAYTRRLTGALNASVSLIDFTTGRQHAGQFIEATATLTTESPQGPPEAPSRQALMRDLYADAMRKALRLINPWDETFVIVVYDDDDASRFKLKPFVEQMKTGDLRGAAEGLRTVVDQGGGPKTTDKDRAKALYDFGVALMYTDRVDEGLPVIERALSLDPKNGIIQEGLVAGRRMASLNKQRAEREANAVVFGTAPAGGPAGAQGASVPARGSSAASRGAAQSAPEGPVITNAEVLELVRAKMADSIILAKIRSARPNFDASTKALIALKQAGASDAIILAVTEAASK